MPSLNDELDQLLRTLDNGIRRQPATEDAIDHILGSPPRESQVRSLRHDPAVEAFRTELSDGLIRVDTANRLLSLVNTLVTAMLTE